MGMTPVPADFDAFWQERMAEADAVDLDYEIMPSEIDPFDTVDYLDLWFTGMGGARIYAKYVKPRAETPIPLVLQFHGYPGSSRSWFEQSSFAGMGCALIAMDNPGQGGKSQDVGGFLGTTVSGHIIAGLDGPLEDMYYVRLHQDVRILCRIVRELPGIDTSRIYVNGASQGGGMGLACCALNSDLIARATILYPFLSDYRRVFELGADEIAYEGIRYYSRWFDPDGTREDEWFAKLAYIDTVSFAHLVRCPILFGTGLDDTVCPVPTQDAVYNHLSCEKERHFFEGKGHVEIQAFDDMIPAYLEQLDARWEEISIPAADGTMLSARYVTPAGEGDHPLVLMFHDHGIEPRGWHHITRFPAIGYAVLELENRSADVDYAQGIADARAAYEKARELAAGAPIICFGDGFGGSLALGVAASGGVAKAAACNPLPYPELIEASASIACPVLIGTSRMDAVASPAGQDELAARIASCRHIDYPKYVHERINAFENELLSFMHL